MTGNREPDIRIKFEKREGHHLGIILTGNRGPYIRIKFDKRGPGIRFNLDREDRARHKD